MNIKLEYIAKDFGVLTEHTHQLQEALKKIMSKEKMEALAKVRETMKVALKKDVLVDKYIK